MRALLAMHACSGRASAKASLELLTSRGYSIDTDALQATTPCPLPPKHALNVTVPGAAAGWVDTVERHGSGKVCAKRRNLINNFINEPAQVSLIRNCFVR